MQTWTGQNCSIWSAWDCSGARRKCASTGEQTEKEQWIFPKVAHTEMSENHKNLLKSRAFRLIQSLTWSQCPNWSNSDSVWTVASHLLGRFQARICLCLVAWIEMTTCVESQLEWSSQYQFVNAFGWPGLWWKHFATRLSWTLSFVPLVQKFPTHLFLKCTG